MRIILLVIDALGIGAMPDTARLRPLDAGANTLGSVLRANPALQIPTLLRLGLGRLLASAFLDQPVYPPLASYGVCQLAYPGADSYLGHQEIMGTIPKPPVATLMREAGAEIALRLSAAGYNVRRLVPGQELLLVNDAVVVGDNLEADAGLNINLTVPTDQIDFDTALRMGQIVRQCVRVSRVIVFGGPGIDAQHILRHVHQRPNGQIGVDSPAVGVYNESLRVQHLGYGVDTSLQAASILSRSGLPVALIGKMADLIACPEASHNPVVPTPAVMQAIRAAFHGMPAGLVAATVQETDLAGHAGDAARFGAILETVDRQLDTLLKELGTQDVLIVCADHGNDPQVHAGQHTREQTPLLIYQKDRPARRLGVRQTLADIGATLTHSFGLQATQDGTPFSMRRRL
jgi:phosphopentomutase